MSTDSTSTAKSLDYFVHESAYVDLPCTIGAGSQIWHFSHIMKDVVIGEKCKIGQNVFVASEVKIGRNVKIQNNVSVYAGVILEDDVFCGPSCVFTNINTPRSAFPRNTIDDYLVTLVKQGATIGANATIVCGHTIGRYAFIGAGSTVTKDIADYALVYGNPAKQVGWMCECGAKLNEFETTTVCKACDRTYEYCGENQIKRME
ncbi:putative acetyltransferase [Tolypothrix sp. NIES-4075]|uniref:acyltransferase n=1 Tax=Tolypothrix sp. NIES-4075 TaxID=2005459 RepID=UPI000B5CA319|nr:acyltransferase [Tolypothrix sp. NIES-4075]GAX42096.1 putative acetyltransferase [Tolypothrix sp. NIES-4075]